MILMFGINESSTTKNDGGFISLINKGEVFAGLDSYAGVNLIRFNGTHYQMAEKADLSDLSELLLALRQAV